MEEPKPNEKSEEEEGDRPENKNLSVLQLADQKIARMEELEQKLGSHVAKLEEIKAIDMLGGSSSAGQVPQKPKVMSDEEYAEKAIAGEIPDVPKKE